MPQIIFPPFAAVINNTAGYAALQAPRRNSANTAWEMGVAGWLDQAQTWAAQQVFLTGTSGQTPLVVRQTGGTAGVNELQVLNDGNNSYIHTANGSLVLSSGGTSTVEINANLECTYDIFFANQDASFRRISPALIAAQNGSGGPGSLAALNYYLGTNVVGGIIAATNSASGAGQTLTITGSSAASGNTNGGPVRVVPGAKSGSGADGYFAVMQPGGTPGTDEVKIYHDGTNGWITVGTGVVAIPSLNTSSFAGNLTASTYFAESSNARAYFQTDTDATHAWTFVNTVATKVPVSIKGAASQSADLWQYQNNSAAVLGGRKADGSIYTVASLGLWGTTPPASQPANASQAAITSVIDPNVKSALQAMYNLLVAYGMAPATA